jgi:hypothetical protein
MALTFNYPQRYWFFMTKQFGGNNYAFFMIAAAVVRQPYNLTGQIHPWAVGLSHCGSRKPSLFPTRLPWYDSPTTHGTISTQGCRAVTPWQQQHHDLLFFKH